MSKTFLLKWQKWPLTFFLESHVFTFKSVYDVKIVFSGSLSSNILVSDCLLPHQGAISARWPAVYIHFSTNCQHHRQRHHHTDELMSIYYTLLNKLSPLSSLSPYTFSISPHMQSCHHWFFIPVCRKSFF